MDYIFIGLGGTLGALARYFLSQAAARRWPVGFPAGTFFINISGSFLLGFLFVLFSRPGVDLHQWKALTTTGFLGAFTTFSTFSYELVKLRESHTEATAWRYLTSSIVFGLLAAWLGIVLARLLFST